jgi:ATP-binding cassette subfamily B protein
MWTFLNRRVFARRRVPVKLQLTPLECGAACLAMILGYHGREVSVGECRSDLDVGRSGLTARDLLRAGRRAGLRVRSYSLEPDKLPLLPLPLIAHWCFNHFVVFEAVHPRGVDIVDPAIGRRRVSHEELDRSFTGVVLTLEPDENFQPGPRTFKGHPYIRSLVKAPGVGPALAKILGTTLGLQLLTLGIPLFTKLIVDDVLPGRLWEITTVLALGMLTWVGMSALTRYLRLVLVVRLRASLDTYTMLGFFERLLQLPTRFFQQRSTGDILMRLSSNMTAREILTEHTLSALLDGGFVVFYGTMLLLIDWSFGVLAAVLGVLQLVILVLTTAPVHRLTQRQLAAQAASQGYAVEVLKGVTTVKAGGAEAVAFEHWRDLFFKHLSISLERAHLGALVQSALRLVQVLAPVLLLWLGTTRVLEGSMTLGTLLALVSLTNAFLSPLANLAGAGQKLQLVRAHLDRLGDVLEAEPEQPGQLREQQLQGHLEVRDLCFGYTRDGPKVLDGISFVAEPGQKIGITGPTGSGKSTLAGLLVGLTTPGRGEVLYDGRRLEEWDLRWLRQQVGFVTQEPFLFSGSVRDNICLNAPYSDLAQVIEAAKIAQIHDDIAALPLGYESLINEGGTMLSGGQRQRLCIARAVLHRPNVLLLDEATSCLDRPTEEAIDRQLDELGATRIVITHRLSTLHNADLVLVLEDGAIVEQGRPEELLAKADSYLAAESVGFDPLTPAVKRWSRSRSRGSGNSKRFQGSVSMEASRQDESEANDGSNSGYQSGR